MGKNKFVFVNISNIEIEAFIIKNVIIAVLKCFVKLFNSLFSFLTNIDINTGNIKVFKINENEPDRFVNDKIRTSKNRNSK